MAAAAALLIVALLLPVGARAWRALGRVDGEVSLRKVHTGEVPRVGGVVVMLGFGAVLLAGLVGVGPLSATHELLSVSPLSGALWGALLAGLTGLADDLAGLRPRTKLVLQLAAAALAVSLGVHWPALERLLGGEAGIVAPLVTAAFLVASVNAINLMDGLDGLAGGLVALGLGVVLVALFAAGTLGPEQVALAWTSAAALGAVGGFLIHNRHPARVFLGDGGAYFLGFLLASLLLGVEPVRWRVPLVQLAIPLLVMALPLFDLVLAVGRRLVRGQPVFGPDGDHVHHRLLAAGLSHARAVWVLWGTEAMFAGLAVLAILGVGGWWTLLGTIVALVVGAIALGYHRLLARLPAFSGRGTQGWRDRRQITMEIFATIDRVATDVDDEGPIRWRRLGVALGPLLASVGVPALEVRRRAETIVAVGSASDAWAWLGLPMPGARDVEVRLALVARLPDLGAEQLGVLERTVAALAGSHASGRGGDRSSRPPRAAA